MSGTQDDKTQKQFKTSHDEKKDRTTRLFRISSSRNC